jgi:hypothetical protein
MINAQGKQRLKTNNTTLINGYVLFTQIKQKLMEGKNVNMETELSNFYCL